MELKIIPRHLVQSSMRRLYSAKAAAQPAPSSSFSPLPKQKTKVSSLPNGMVVASIENYNPVAQIAVVVKAGPRYEGSKNKGVSHTLRNCAGLTTKDATVFGITRNIQQIGGSLSATSSRENMTYTLECVRNQLDTGLKFLSQVSTRPTFKPWEIRDFLPRMQVELALLREQPHILLSEYLHKAAFRTGLANSIYCPKYMVGKHKPDTLKQYVKDTFTTNRMAIVGVGINHEELKEFANSLKVDNGAGVSDEPAKYCGGEVRKEMGVPYAYVAVVGEGASLKNPKDVIASGILQSVMGTVPNIKRGNSTAKLFQAASKATSNPFAVSSLNMNYSDSGLFGFYLVGQPEDMGKLVKAVVGEYNAVAKAGISDGDLQKAKHKLKAAVHMADESGTDVVDEMALQALATGKVLDGLELDQLVDSVTATDVNNLAKKIVGGKAAMASVGNLSSTPYLDQLR